MMEELYDCYTLPDVPKEIEFDSLEKMVEWYAKYRKPVLFKRMHRNNTLLDCITGAPGKNKKRLPNSRDRSVPRYKKGSHQRRLTNEVINRFWDAMEKLDLAPEKFSGFDSFVDFIWAHRTSGYAANCVYDFCLNYGYKHGLIPEKTVFVHSGPLAAVKALKRMGLLSGEIRNNRISLDALPPVIQKLEAPYAEDFLCVFKNDIIALENKQ